MPVKISGIYFIVSTQNQMNFYIGSSRDLFGRWRSHINRLKRNNHENAILQNHYNKHGISNLLFEVFSFCSQSELITTEQFFLDTLKPCWNIRQKASNVGYRKSSLSTRKKISLSWQFRSPISMFSRLYRKRVPKPDINC